MSQCRRLFRLFSYVVKMVCTFHEKWQIHCSNVQTIFSKNAKWSATKVADLKYLNFLGVCFDEMIF